jgi:hypothetical protein
MLFCGELMRFTARYRDRRRRCHVALIGVLCTAAIFGLARLSAAQWISYSSNPRNILEGNWQSCPESSGRYAERVYDHVVGGVGLFEVHLGPRREFAMFPNVQDGHRAHDSPENLLKPYRVSMQGTRARQRWEIPSLKLALTVTLGGGSTTDCESWYVVLEPLDKPSH